MIIRPPSEWRSLLVRITRGCNWNRCRFCGIYPAMGEPDFSLRTLPEITADIDLLLRRHPAPKTIFLGDADPLAAGMTVFTGVLRHLRASCNPDRITCYARASTLHKLGQVNIQELALAGVNRVHLGLESGDEEILRFQRKGQSAAMVKTVAPWLKEAGIELSCYVLLGLGGTLRWQPHIEQTATLLNTIQPEFIRLRRLWLYGKGTTAECPLYSQIRDGSFVEQTPDGTVAELQLLLENLQPFSAFFACDHANNYLNVSGRLDHDLATMRQDVAAFLAQPEARRTAHYQMIGSRI